MWVMVEHRQVLSDGLVNFISDKSSVEAHGFVSKEIVESLANLHPGSFTIHVCNMQMVVRKDEDQIASVTLVPDLHLQKGGHVRRIFAIVPAEKFRGMVHSHAKEVQIQSMARRDTKQLDISSQLKLASRFSEALRNLYKQNKGLALGKSRKWVRA